MTRLRMRTGMLVLALTASVSVAAVATGATAATGAFPARAVTTNAPLVGTSWALTNGASLGVPLARVAVTAVFSADNKLSGVVACNSYNATYQASGRSMRISPTASTLAACTAREDAVARVYLQRLPRVRRFAISGSTMSMADGQGRTLLSYRAQDPEQALVGSWTATGYYTGTAIQSVAVGSRITADFTRSQISGNSGCNTYSGPYTTTSATGSGTGISIGPLASTLRLCVDDAVNKQEQQYLAALQLARSFVVSGDRLELLRDGGAIAATFVRAS